MNNNLPTLPEVRQAFHHEDQPPRVQAQAPQKRRIEHEDHRQIGVRGERRIRIAK